MQMRCHVFSKRIVVQSDVASTSIGVAQGREQCIIWEEGTRAPPWGLTRDAGVGHTHYAVCGRALE